jgi:N-acetylated-alpha-linked acidic dipeptidase
VQAEMLHQNAFVLAADPTLSSGTPTPLQAVPAIDLSAMDAAVKRLSASASAYDAALAEHGGSLSAPARRRLDTLMLSIDQTLAPAVGLPQRPWFKNLIYAPGRYTGYGAKTLPGITEAIEEERWADANTYARLTADALNDYSGRLEQATVLLNQR